MVQPPPEQELEDMSIKELEAIKTQLDQKLYIANLKQQILQTQAQLHSTSAHENQDTRTPDSSAHRKKRPQTDIIPTKKRPSRFKIKDPYTFWSWKLKGLEVRYEVYNSELLVVVEAFKH
ncbi:uncharacterized protein TRUGW13939_02464 [Talaromyces rugulosus]|uniref:Uncharacterized protein n=1 Tax=Talaromyces rugulosus TaxID=121627 RepID=A0A7H8QND2_TALRU|nr:uncharacterized protein TRUGW13939_02464 [Talaromyces rugulosus]QKX55372.1 hypothetical protein TRUGW13939_02464 [Talaromyces rugulosus]